LEAWFDRFPSHAKAALRARFCSPDEVPHLSAFFELYLHELLLVLGYSVEIAPTEDPGIGQTRPDFLVHCSTQVSFYLEATIATNRSAKDAASKARLNQVYDALNKLDSPNFFVGVESYGNPASPVPQRQLRVAVQDFLEQLDPDNCACIPQEGGLAALPRKWFKHDGWCLEFFPIPKAKGARGKPGLRTLGMVGPAEPYRVDNRSALRGAVVKKATRYGELGKPYIVAVNAVNQHLDDLDIMSALFGQESLMVQPIPDTPQAPRLERGPEGAWWRPQGPTNTRVSAAFVVSALTPWSIRACSSSIYHNPWAKYPCLEVFEELWTARSVVDEMKVMNGRSAADLFGLSDTWPK